MKLHDARPKPGSRTARKRIGRGPGSGTGKTSGRGHKGAKSRSGFKNKAGFEGGQMPLIRRIPKRGFRNPGRVRWAEVNVDQLGRFAAGAVVDPQSLRDAGLISGRYDKVVIMGRGDVDVALSVKVHRFTRTAADKIVAAGGSTEVLG